MDFWADTYWADTYWANIYWTCVILPAVVEPYEVCIHEGEPAAESASATNCAYVPELVDGYSEQNLVYNIDAVQYSTKNTTRICKT